MTHYPYGLFSCSEYFYGHDVYCGREEENVYCGREEKDVLCKREKKNVAYGKEEEMEKENRHLDTGPVIVRDLPTLEVLLPMSAYFLYHVHLKQLM